MKNGIKLQQKETYISPDIEIVEIETEQNILLQASGVTGEGSSDNPSINNLDMESERW